MAVRVERIGKTFPGTAGPVLDDISFGVAAGELVSLVGASGCGKSTLLAIIAGLEAATTGSVTTSGRPALMFQDHALFPWLNARANVELALRLRGIRRRERHQEAERLLDLMHLSGQGDKRVHELSGGMRQRVALARALAQGARVLLMDEPFAALDAITRDSLHAELTRIRHETGIAVVFVTHNVREAVRLGDRVMLLTSVPGRIAQEWQVPISHPRRIESSEVSRLSVEITAALSEEIRRHGR
ncbi:MAG TPA: ABC transporter ATP-binding protein [Dermatophilaceae bacterium]|nr:ABC transporter ATP-binding protein [Dermatophilaceae bacterium]